MSLRVIAGSFGGRRLVAPRGRATRPTSERVREAVFSILGPVAGFDVLDLFAGSGALGLEAVSRGAAAAVLVDSAAAAVAAGERNVRALGVEGRARVVRADALGFLRTARREQRQYDLVFLDPPYDRAAGLSASLSPELAAVLSPGGRVVAESDRRAPLALALPVVTERAYGDTLIQIHSRSDDSR
jgi:16S rRNA (guanine966-N2)-methyltransferase